MITFNFSITDIKAGLFQLDSGSVQFQPKKPVKTQIFKYFFYLYYSLIKTVSLVFNKYK